MKQADIYGVECLFIYIMEGSESAMKNTCPEGSHLNISSRKDDTNCTEVD